MDHGSASFLHDHKARSSYDSNPLQVENPFANTEALSSNPISNVGVQIGPAHVTSREEEWHMPITNITRIMRHVLPQHAKVSEESKETMQECVTEFISFITSEASYRCQKESRRIVSAEDILWAMEVLGLDNYAHLLTLFLRRYRLSYDIQNLGYLGEHLPVSQVASSDPMSPPLPPFSPFSPLFFGPQTRRPNLSASPNLYQGMFDSMGMHEWNQDGLGHSGLSSDRLPSVFDPFKSAR